MKYNRIPDVWWCDLHNEVHLGNRMLDFEPMEHRKHLHPVFWSPKVS